MPGNFSIPTDHIQRSRQLKRLILILKATACTQLVASDTGALGG